MGEIRSRSTSVPSINMTAVSAMPRTPFTTTLEGKGGQDQPSQVLRTARLRAAAGRFDSAKQVCEVSFSYASVADGSGHEDRLGPTLHSHHSLRLPPELP